MCSVIEHAIFAVQRNNEKHSVREQLTPTEITNRRVDTAAWPGKLRIPVLREDWLRVLCPHCVQQGQKLRRGSSRWRVSTQRADQRIRGAPHHPMQAQARNQ